MIVKWPTYLVKYIAMIWISSRMTSEISGYIEYNYIPHRTYLNTILNKLKYQQTNPI